MRKKNAAQEAEKAKEYLLIYSNPFDKITSSQRGFYLFY